MNEWIEQYKQYHLENTDYGNGGCLKFYLQHIVDLVQDWNAESLLDFGCGKAETFDQIFSRADKFVFLGIATSPAEAVLPNGDNAHCTVEPIGWWEEMVHKHAPKKVCTHIKTAGYCNNYSILNEDLYMEYFLNNLEIKEKTS